MWCLLLSACASSGAASRGRNANLIGATELEELRRSGVPDLYELINRARPRWLQIRNERSLQLETVILVYHHETRLGGIEVLRGYPLTSITSLRYLDAAQAGLLPGAGSAHVQGAIVISTSGGTNQTRTWRHVRPASRVAYIYRVAAIGAARPVTATRARSHTPESL